MSRRADPARLPFETTDELAPLDEIIGQDRAVAAIRFGIGIDRPGYHVFAYGPPGHGKLTTIRRFLATEARKRPTPSGWCYVHGFADRTAPRALQLPAGRAIALQTEMHYLVEDLLQELPKQFEGDVYAARRRDLIAGHEERANAAMESMAGEAESHGLGLFREDEGWRILPAAGDAAMTQEQFAELPEAEQERLVTAARSMQEALEAAIKTVEQEAERSRAALRALERSFAATILRPRVDAIRERFADVPGFSAYLTAVEADILDRLELFRQAPGPDQSREEGEPGPRPDDSPRARRRADPRLRRYEVNVLVDHEGETGAPVVNESHPTLGNLVGYAGYEERFGVRQTDFTLIRPGALHRANGGFLVLEIDEVLKQPKSWDALKRALRGARVRLETLGDEGDPGPLEPEAIPLDVKVILVGDPYVYFQLYEHDPDFPELFKVGAEFSDDMRRDEDGEDLYARFVASVVSREGMRPFHRDAVAGVIDYSARLADDAARLSTGFMSITDLLREADFWAGERGSDVVGSEDIARAIGDRDWRADRLREEMHDNLRRGVLRIDTSGTAVGAVNAMTVIEQGDFAFGLPARVSARVRMGGGEVLDIEREVDLGGPIHTKGVLILGGFLGGRYLPDEPLAMAASITFEQSYHHIDGDSASVAELLAILSGLAGVPLRQDLAVTGSVSQDGDIQSVGGLNEKVEGFFDVCKLRGLSGTQGVAIPKSNVQHLMLRPEVVKACQDGAFQVYALADIDDAIALFSGMEPGERAEDGRYPEGTFNRKVEDRLGELAEKRRELGHGGDGEDEDPPEHADTSDRKHPRRPRSG